MCYHAGGASRKSTDIIGQAVNLYKNDLFNIYQHFKSVQLTIECSIEFYHYLGVNELSLLKYFLKYLLRHAFQEKTYVEHKLYFHSEVLVRNQTTEATILFLLIYTMMEILVHAWYLPLAPKSSYGKRGPL